MRVRIRSICCAGTRADGEVGGVLHCFTESWEMARAAIDLGFYISISGIVTFHQAQNVRDMARQIPLERLLIETDSPWLSPAPYRGKPNHPGRVGLVAAKLAEIRDENLETLAAATFDNACRLFCGRIAVRVRMLVQDAVRPRYRCGFRAAP